MFPRPPLLAALPWTALGVQDWRLCLIQSAAVWWLLGRDSKRRSADAALTLGLLFAALLDALLYLPDLKSAALKFVITGPVALALAAGVLGIRNGQRWALVIPAGLLLLGPTLIGVAGLLIGALGLSGPETRQPQALGPLSAGASAHGQLTGRPGALIWLGGAVILLSAFAWLPQPATLQRDRTPVNVVQKVPAPAGPPSADVPKPSSRVNAAQPRPTPPQDPNLTTLLNATTLPLLGMLLLCLALLRRTWGRVGTRVQALTLLLEVGLLVAVGLFVLGLLAQPEQVYRVVGQVFGPPAEPLPTGTGSVRPPISPLPFPIPGWLIWAISALAFALLARAAWWVLRLSDADDQAGADTPAAHLLGGETLAGPPGRVRAAYAEALRLLAARGLARAPSETPDELLRRAAARWPAAAAPLEQLTDAYRPVRYGGLADSAYSEQHQDTNAQHISQAEAAEAGAAGLRAVLDDLPPPQRRP